MNQTTCHGNPEQEVVKQNPPSDGFARIHAEGDYTLENWNGSRDSLNSRQSERERRASNASVHSIGSSAGVRERRERDFYRSRGTSENSRSRSTRPNDLPSLAHDNFALSISYDQGRNRSNNYVNRPNSSNERRGPSRDDDRPVAKSIVGSKLETDPGPVTYVAAGTAPTDRLPTLRETAPRSSPPAAVTTYAGPASRLADDTSSNVTTQRYSAYTHRYDDGNPPSHPSHAHHSHSHGGGGYFGGKYNRHRDRDYRRNNRIGYAGNPEIHNIPSSAPFFHHDKSEKSALEALSFFTSLQQQCLAQQRLFSVPSASQANLRPDVLPNENTVVTSQASHVTLSTADSKMVDPNNDHSEQQQMVGYNMMDSIPNNETNTSQNLHPTLMAQQRTALLGGGAAQNTIPGLYPQLVGRNPREAYGHRMQNMAEIPQMTDEYLMSNLPFLMSLCMSPSSMSPLAAQVAIDEEGVQNGSTSQWQQMMHMSGMPAPVNPNACPQTQDYYRMVDIHHHQMNKHHQTMLSNNNKRSLGNSEPIVPSAEVAASQVSEETSIQNSNDLEEKKEGFVIKSSSNNKVEELQSQRKSGESGYQSESSPPLPIDQLEINGVGSGEALPAASKVSTTRPDKKACQWDPVPSGSSATATVSSVSSKKPPQPPPITRSSAPRAPPAGPVDATGKLEVSKMDVLSEEIWYYHNSVTQTESTLNKKLHLRDMLYYAICPVFPMCGLYVVGSSLNGFGNNSSDMDLCLMITNKDLDQKTDAVVVLNMILSTLRQIDWVAHQQLILAKVPILRIKFAAPFGDITVDLNANNSVAIKNTHLLCYYSSFDWRVRPLVTIVKEWAKRKGINDANRSSFTSYSLVLMVIHYLQCGAEPPVLPSLQQMYSNRFSNRCDVRSLNVTLPLNPPPDEWAYNDKATLGELLIGFLHYYATTFDYNRDAISVRMGKRVDRAVVAKHRPQGNNGNNNWRSQWRCICIEEPFTYSNTAHSIYDEMVFDAIKDAFREAYEELDCSRDIQKLLSCRPIKAQPPNGGAVVLTASPDVVMAYSKPDNKNQYRKTASPDSVRTARSGRSSCASSTSGGDNDNDRSRDSPITQILASVACAPISATSPPPSNLNTAANGSRNNGGRRRNHKKSGRI